MTALPDPVQFDGPTAARGRRLLSPGFWLMLAFCALCLLAAVAVVTLGPRFAPRQTAAAPATVATPPVPPAFAPPAGPPAALAAPPADVSDLADRVSRLEGDQAGERAAAASALAAAALSEAAAQPRPFGPELVAVARLLPDSADLAALAPLARQGAPTRAALAAELSALAAQASVAARAPGKGASFMDQMAYAVARVVSVRRVDGKGAGADAVLARAERRAIDGDTEGASALIDSLGAQAQASLASWRERAGRRIEIDRHIAALREQAMNRLAQPGAAAS